MDFAEIIKKVTAGDIPSWGMGGGGIVLLLVVMRMAKGFAKIFCLLLALALLAGAAWWYLHQH